ncbi:NAD(P)-binding protein [Ophiobolus disseminans]|uniref:NAD(P)-binding protein n=1 Tax=Ophiobolus disseminans TaxID=1469910 RepID=A0A6A7AFX5_9PLEO|nr:NAD(P)-binding protein [Ophiobolus disseminans]
MSSNSIKLNTSSTPEQAGRWVVTKHGPPSVLKWEPVDLSSLDPDRNLEGKGVLVRIIVAGIAGVDNIQRVGGYPDPRCKTPGYTTGYDIVGEIVSVGKSVPKEIGLHVGDRVASLCMFGAHATHILLPYDEVMRLEKTDDPIKIGALPLNYMTAWGMLKHSGVHLPPGSTILIGSASGGLGTAMAQLVTAFKMDLKMIGTCSPSKFDYVRSLGVQPIDRTAPDIVEQVLKLTNGQGVDVAYDPVGSKESSQNSSAAAKPETGRVVVVGVMDSIASDGSGMSKNPQEVFAEILQPPRITFWALDTSFFKKPEIAEFYAVVDKVRSGALNPVVFKSLRLSQGVEAHELLVNGSSVKGKMLFIVEEALAAQHGI